MTVSVRNVPLNWSPYHSSLMQMSSTLLTTALSCIDKKCERFSEALLLVVGPLLLGLSLLLSACPPAFGWGHGGHAVVGLIAEHYTTGAALTKAGDLLGGPTIDAVASWADDYRRDHRETGPWHYIDVPLADSKIDLARECPNGDCVIAKTEYFLGVLRDRKADRSAKAEALKFVVHFVGDLHQPLHDEDDGDKGGNTRHVIF
jgi:S1/P1 Nuclease